jgi:uncharacterized protein (DUF58 family)
MKVITVHRSGVIYIVASIVIGLLAINGGNNFHYLAAAAILGYMLASGVAGRRNVRSAAVSLSFPDEIYAGRPFPLSVEVSNRSRAPVFMIDVKIAGAAVFFPVIQPGETAVRQAPFVFPSRGRAEIGGGDIELSSTYPFDFFTRYWPVEFKGSAAVFPAPISSGDLPVFAAPEGEDARRRRARATNGDVAGVRPYAEGDALRDIHWKSAARTGKLNTRVYEPDAGAGAKIIDLDALLPFGEKGLSAASYEIAAAIETRRPIGMKGAGRVWPPSDHRRDKLAMLASLALYDEKGFS